MVFMMQHMMLLRGENTRDMDLADLFPGFESHWIDVRMGRIFARAGGDGPPLLLLHGFPQTHVMIDADIQETL